MHAFSLKHVPSPDLKWHHLKISIKSKLILELLRYLKYLVSVYIHFTELT